VTFSSLISAVSVHWVWNGYKWVKLDIAPMHEIKNITITSEILKLIADIDEFKGRWKVIETLAPERLTSPPAHRYD